MWDPGISQVETQGALQQGSTLLVTQRDGSQSTWTVLELQKPERLVLQRPHGRSTEVRMVWEIRPEGDGAQIQQVTTLLGGMLQVLARTRDKAGLQQASATQLAGMVEALKGKHRSGGRGDRPNSPSAS